MRKILRKKNIKYYLLFYGVIELISKFSFTRGIVGFIYNAFLMATKAPSLEAFIKAIVILIIIFVIWLLISVFMTLPVTITLLAIKSADATQERQNKKYTSRENIIYYREKLDGISPTTISLMENLKVEEEKDLTATIMKLQLNKNIVIEEDTIKIISDDVSNLNNSEKHIFYMLADGKINKKQIEDWKKIALEEARTQGYIKEQNSSTGIVIKKIILIALFIVFCLGFKYIDDDFMILKEQFESVELDEELGIYEALENENIGLITNLILVSLAMLVCGVGMIAWPIFYIVYIIRYKNKNNSLKRTTRGEQLTDEILGMKRFLHDFSMLNEADKESIALWDDFLIYAIILEENKTIIDEILEVKNIKYFDSIMLIQK